MFYVSAKGKDYVGRNTYFLNDAKDIIDLAFAMDIDDAEINNINLWLYWARFGSCYKSENLVIYCLKDADARYIASILGCLPEYEKQYGTAKNVNIANA